jgi:hypothetical protein
VNGRVVVLHGGAPMEMNWADHVQGILLLYLGNEAGGAACADFLLGKANPGDKLAESWPFTYADSSPHDYFLVHASSTVDAPLRDLRKAASCYYNLSQGIRGALRSLPVYRAVPAARTAERLTAYAQFYHGRDSG